MARFDNKTGDRLDPEPAEQTKPQRGDETNRAVETPAQHQQQQPQQGGKRR